MITELTDTSYQAELAPHRVAVVKVFAPWCGPCKFMRAAYERYAKTFSDYPFYELNHDKCPEFVNKFDAHSLPTFMFFVHGVHTFSIQGITRTKVFEGILNRALAVKVDYGKTS